MITLNHNIIHINLSLILKIREIICFSGQITLISHFEGYFEGGQDFFDPLNCPENVTHTHSGQFCIHLCNVYPLDGAHLNFNIFS
jgi:hypothetical protein